MANIADQLLWIETLLKGGIGLVMLLMPILSAKIVGLPHGTSALWPRLFGAALLGMAAAFAVEGFSQLNANVTVRGLGLGGAIAINLVSVLSLIGTLVFKGVKTRRGLLLLWTCTLLLILLMLFEIAHA